MKVDVPFFAPYDLRFYAKRFRGSLDRTRGVAK